MMVAMILDHEPPELVLCTACNQLTNFDDGFKGHFDEQSGAYVEGFVCDKCAPAQIKKGVLLALDQYVP